MRKLLTGTVIIVGIAAGLVLTAAIASAQTLNNLPDINACEADPPCLLDPLTATFSCAQGYEFGPGGTQCVETPPPCDLAAVQAAAEADPLCQYGYTLSEAECNYTCLEEPAVTGVYGGVPKAGAGEWDQIAGSELTTVSNGGAAVDCSQGTPWYDFRSSIVCQRGINTLRMWTGFAFDEATGRLVSPAAGGHSDYGGNEVLVYGFANNEWSRPFNPQPLDGPFMYRNEIENGVVVASVPNCQRPSVGPPSNHHYGGTLHLPGTNKFLVFGTSAFYSGCNRPLHKEPDHTATRWAYEWDSLTNGWTYIDTVLNTYKASIAYDESTGIAYVLTGDDRHIRSYDVASGWTLLADDYLGAGAPVTAILDNDRDVMYYTTNYGLRRFAMPFDGTTEQIVAAGSVTPAFAIHRPTGDVYLWYGASHVAVWRFADGSVESVVPPFGPPPNGGDNKLYRKFFYVAEIDSFVGTSNPQDGIWTFSPWSTP